MVQVIFPVKSLPDPQQTSLKLRFGDVRKEIFAGWKGLLRMTAEMEPGKWATALCFRYDPALDQGVQGRLRLWIRCDCSDSELARTMILKGPVSEFYFPEQIAGAVKDPPPIPWTTFAAVAEVIRRIDLISPYIEHKQNRRVPQTAYQSLLPFKAEDDNDYLGLDRMLSGSIGPVYIEVGATPAIIQDDLRLVYEDISRMALINEGVYHEPRNEQERERREFGFMKDHLADELRRDYEDLAKALRQPQLNFWVRVLGATPQEVTLLAAEIAESAFAEGKYRILSTQIGDAEFERVLEATRQGKIIHNWQHSSEVDASVSRLARTAGVEELAGVFRLPVASQVSPRTIRKHTDPEPPKPDEETGRPPKTLLVGDDMESGLSAERDLGAGLTALFDVEALNCLEHRLLLELLKKHMFICGVPGSGKTTAVINLLVQLYRHGIPFLIIEPAKTEYRILKKLKGHRDKTLDGLGSKLQIFTPGNEKVSPFRFNPFSFPKGISLDEHLNNLLNCFRSAMTLPEDTPLPALLGKAVEEVYEGFEEKGFPHMEDLVLRVGQMIDSPELKYTADVKNTLKTAIEVRLSPLVSKKRSIGKIFSRDLLAPTVESLMAAPVILEMDSLDTEQANLVTLFFLTAVREHIKASRLSGQDLTHVIVLEEAHNVVGDIPEGAANDDPRKKAADYISRMLAELRALGEGIIISDQLPSTVAATVVKNTGTKLAHRLTSMDDRREIGYTMLLTGPDIEEFARLQVGEAFYYTEGLYRPRRVRCIDSTKVLGFAREQPPADSGLIPLLQGESWYRPQELRRLWQDLDDFNAYLKRTRRVVDEFDRQAGTLSRVSSSSHGAREKEENAARLGGLLDRIRKSIDALDGSLGFLDELNLRAGALQYASEARFINTMESLRRFAKAIGSGLRELETRLKGVRSKTTKGGKHG